MFEAVTPDEIPSPLRLTRTITVLALLSVTAVVFSYLGAFAVTTVLVNADLLEKWPPGVDPRPRWMVLSLGYIAGIFSLIATVLKWTSYRQMKRIDAAAEEDF